MKKVFDTADDIARHNRNQPPRKPRFAHDMTDSDYAAACVFCLAVGFVSTGRIQRHLGIGFNAAAKLVEWMEDRDFCSGPDRLGRRKIKTQAREGN